jgi:hypothetical protein
MTSAAFLSGEDAPPNAPHGTYTFGESSFSLRTEKHLLPLLFLLLLLRSPFRREIKVATLCLDESVFVVALVTPVVAANEDTQNNITSSS